MLFYSCDLEVFIYILPKNIGILGSLIIILIICRHKIKGLS